MTSLAIGAESRAESWAESHSDSKETQHQFISLHGNPRTHPQSISPWPVFHDDRDAPDPENLSLTSLAASTDSTPKLLDESLLQYSWSDSME